MTDAEKMPGGKYIGLLSKIESIKARIPFYSKSEWNNLDFIAKVEEMVKIRYQSPTLDLVVDPDLYNRRLRPVLENWVLLLRNLRGNKL